MRSIQIKWKLLAAYLAVIAVCIIVVILVTRQLTLSSYSEHLQRMHGMNGMMNGMVADLDQSFRRVLNEALIWGGGAAVITAVIISFLLSSRITSPIHTMAAVTRKIAAGDFSRRVDVTSKDELGSLAQSLNLMAESLDQAEQQRRELMANVAHELRTPLASISGYMEGLADGVVPANRETYDLVKGEAYRLERLVNDLQRLSRAESGEEQLDLVDIRLGPLMERIRKSFAPRFSVKQVVLNIDVVNEELAVRADEDKLEQVLINLLDNALGYTDAGGSVIVAEKLRGDLAEIRVTDTGSGIDPGDLPHIFERFYRADKSRSRESGGSGIGLTIAKSYVEAMGGRITAKSVPGSGTTFIVMLPSAR